MILPNDYSRCMDADCPLAERCARYQQRMIVHGDGVGWVVRAQSLRNGDDDCKNFIDEKIDGQ